MMPNEIKKTGDTIEWHPRMMKIKCSLLLRQVWRHFLNRVYKRLILKFLSPLNKFFADN